MIYVNDCSIRVVRSCIKIFVQEIFVQILHTKIILQRKKANDGIIIDVLSQVNIVMQTVNIVR